jgi:uncharacterized protein
MPWTPEQAKKKMEGMDDAQAAEWCKIANGVLESEMKKPGMDKSKAEGMAIATANKMMKEKMGKRSDPAEVECRTWKTEELRVFDDGGKPKIRGLAVPYGQSSELIQGMFREKFLPGAFADSLKTARGFVNVEHDKRSKLGRFGKEATATEDGRGVWVEVTPPNTRVGQDTLEEARSGMLDAMSIEFRLSDPRDAEFHRHNGELFRTIKKAELVGVALTSYPAYPQTAGTIAVRSLEEWRQAEDEAAKAAQQALEAAEREKAERAAIAENAHLRARLDLAAVEI